MFLLCHEIHFQIGTLIIGQYWVIDEAQHKDKARQFNLYELFIQY